MWNFFFKTVCNTNPAKTIVQKVTKQQSLGLMQYRLYRNSHDEMCRSGTVNTKEPRRRLIFQPTVCVLDFFFPQNFHTTNRHLDQPSKLWWKCAVQKRPWRNRSPEAMKIRKGWAGTALGVRHGLCRRMWTSLDCSGYWNLVITSHPTRFSLNVSLHLQMRVPARVNAD